MSRIANLISGGIGLATEAHAARKRANSPQPGSAPPAGRPVQPNGGKSDALAPPPYDGTQGSDLDLSGDDSQDDDDEDDWIRDETQDQIERDSGVAVASGNDAADVDQLVADFERRHPPPKYIPKGGILPCPVVIPQRRPGTRHRGFVRAYAPVLNEASIDQETFMDFLKGFDKAINKMQFFNAANLAVAVSVISYTAAVAPSAIVQFSAMAVHISLETGRRLYMNKSTNTYLEQMNEKLFQPRGLYAMLMTYKPDSLNNPSEMIDINANTLSSVAAGTEGNRSKFHSTSGKTTGASQIPEAAPLIFPGIEAASDEQKVNAFKKAGHFLTDYGDKRANAKFAARNPDTAALQPQSEQEFASRFSDPNHPVNNGGLIGLLSGGAVSSRKSRRRQQGGRRRSGRPTETDALGKAQRGGLVGTAKRQLKENVVYLMIVNMPSEAELKEAAEMERRYKEGNKML